MSGDGVIAAERWISVSGDGVIAAERCKNQGVLWFARARAFGCAVPWCFGLHRFENRRSICVRRASCTFVPKSGNVRFLYERFGLVVVCSQSSLAALGDFSGHDLDPAGPVVDLNKIWFFVCCTPE